MDILLGVKNLSKSAPGTLWKSGSDFLTCHKGHHDHLHSVMSMHFSTSHSLSPVTPSPTLCQIRYATYVMPHTIQQSGSIANVFLFTFTQSHGLNNETGMLRFHTVEKYTLNASRQFSGDQQFAHQVDLVGPGVHKARWLIKKFGILKKAYIAFCVTWINTRIYLLKYRSYCWNWRSPIYNVKYNGRFAKIWFPAITFDWSVLRR